MEPSPSGAEGVRPKGAFGPTDADPSGEAKALRCPCLPKEGSTSSNTQSHGANPCAPQLEAATVDRRGKIASSASTC